MGILDAILGFVKRAPATEAHETLTLTNPEFKPDFRMQEVANNACRMLEVLCPDKVFPRMEIGNILMHLHSSSFSGPDLELSRRIERIDLKELKSKLIIVIKKTFHPMIFQTGFLNVSRN